MVFSFAAVRPTWQALPALARLTGAAVLCLHASMAPAQYMAKGPLPAGATAQHEQQLQAIRQALLETTLEKAPTRVVSAAWVDDKGALHENHTFQSGAEVRGVRVLSYLQEGDAPPRASVAVDVLPWDLRPRAEADKACDKPARALRRPIASRMEISGPLAGAQQAAALSVLSSAHDQWAQLLLQSGQWSPLAWPTPSPSTYQKALLRSPGEEAHDWRATLSLQPAPEVQSLVQAWVPTDLNPWSRPAPWRWTLSLQITQRPAGSSGFREVARQQALLELDPQLVADHPRRGLQALNEQVQAHLVQWQRQLQEHTRCESAQFVVRREPNASLLLQAGAASGLRVGDRVLLLQPGWVPSRLLDASALEHLALAEVVQTGSRLTELRQLAGPSIPLQGEWVALPL